MEHPAAVEKERVDHTIAIKPVIQVAVDRLEARRWAHPIQRPRCTGIARSHRQVGRVRLKAERRKVAFQVQVGNIRRAGRGRLIEYQQQTFQIARMRSISSSVRGPGAVYEPSGMVSQCPQLGAAGADEVAVADRVQARFPSPSKITSCLPSADSSADSKCAAAGLAAQTPADRL